jgi:nitrite reductase/ring-hydroxylating ferredoxin subunit/metal-sulfur cluster biosynthetic enzyme
MSAPSAATQFVKAARVEDVPVGGKTVVEVDDRMLALFHLPDGFFALDDVCTHDDGPLSDGVMGENTIACPRHGAQFDIRTGKALTMPATRPTGSYPCKVENGDVLIAIGSATTAVETSSAEALAASQSSSIIDMPVLAKKDDCTVPPPNEAATEAAVAAATASGEISEDVLREALKAVIDPELFVNIVDLGLIYNVTVSDRAEDEKKHVAVEMTMTSPACPAGPQLLQGCKDALNRGFAVGCRRQVVGLGSYVSLGFTAGGNSAKPSSVARSSASIFLNVSLSQVIFTS